MEKILSELVAKTKSAVGENLRSIVLYGSAASGEYHAKHSDLNTMCLLHQVRPADLRELHKPAKWLIRKGHPAPLVFALEELREAADFYAIELLEIKMHRRILYGEDVFDEIEVPMRLHRAQVERELRHQLIRLRQGYVAAAGERKALLALAVRSVSIFGLLFRHVLIALGEEAAISKRDAVERLAARLGFDASGFRPLFELREGRRTREDFRDGRVFEKCLSAASEAVSVVNRTLSELPD